MAELIGAEKVAKAREQTRKRKEEEAREKREHTIAYNAGIKKGYKPNRETLLAQIEALYADSKISIQEYEWGLIGVNLVHGMIADGVQAENEAEVEAGVAEEG